MVTAIRLRVEREKCGDIDIDEIVYRCSRDSGHVGSHALGGHSWFNDEESERCKSVAYKYLGDPGWQCERKVGHPGFHKGAWEW